MDKCPICDGTGTSNTCVNGTFKPCSFCDGTGECDANEVDRFNAVDFIKVMEMVKNPQTNEEWFCQLPTDEKARWLEEKMTWAAQEQGTFTAKGWEMWLKQPHK